MPDEFCLLPLFKATIHCAFPEAFLTLLQSNVTSMVFIQSTLDFKEEFI